MHSPVRRISSAAITVAGLSALLAVALIGTGRVGWVSALISLTAVVYLAVALVGAAVLRTRPASRTGWIFLVSGTAAPIGAALAASADVSGRAAPWLILASTPFFLLGVPLMATFGILLFPDRGLGTRNRRVLAWVYAGELLVLLIWGLFSHTAMDQPGISNPIAQPWADGLVLSILVLGPLSLFACVSLLRFARRAAGDDAPGLRTAARVAFVVPVAYLACVVAGFTTGDTAPISVLENCAAIALGVAAWVGIARYGLFDTRAVLSRALVYGGLSVLLVAVYLGVVVSLGLFAGGLVPQVVAAVAAALAVLPLRDLVHRKINKLVYGLRDDPAAAFARLGDRLDAAGEPEEMLPAAARTVAEALRLPYVAIEVGLPPPRGATPAPSFGAAGDPSAGDSAVDAPSAGDSAVDARSAGAPAADARSAAVPAADARSAGAHSVDAFSDGGILCRHGRRLPGPVEALPLPFAGETIGRLVWQDRADGGLRSDERRLLSDLTRQVAVAARAVLLTQALQTSRQRLVAAREEERRRLRRDLHDGLGPTLAGIALGIDTVRRATPPGGSTADLLDTLRQATEATVDDIRRIVYDLRPPILDELGLAGAVREQALRLGAADIDVPETLPVLPAAVEVAAYRIAVEALTNASRHAPGTPVSVLLAVNGSLELSVADGGAGLPDGFRAGVGLNSMRERAAELGGRCVVSRRDPRGTVVRAEFPLPEAAW